MPSFYAYVLSRSIAKSASHLYAFWVSYTAKVYQACEDANVGLCVQRVNKESYLMVIKAVRT